MKELYKQIMSNFKTAQKFRDQPDQARNYLGYGYREVFRNQENLTDFEIATFLIIMIELQLAWCEEMEADTFEYMQWMICRFDGTERLLELYMKQAKQWMKVGRFKDAGILLSRSADLSRNHERVSLQRKEPVGQ